VGKTTICNKILETRSDVCYSVSATSRPKRKSEQNGHEYIFLSRKEFEKWIAQDKFIEYAEVHGNLYGTPRKDLENHMTQGLNVLMDVDVRGAKKLMESYPDGIFFFIVPPNFAELEQRLLKRNTEENDVIKHRLERAREELTYRDDYKYIIENRDIDDTVAIILSIIKKELGK
jgi:guanylate kinase